jgi:uncharacterized protein (DUF1697 family)
MAAGRGYAALLRGVNVGGKKLAMAELRAALSALALSGVQTYVQSGNVVFESPESDGGVLEAVIEELISVEFGMDVAVVVRDRAELEEVRGANPFQDEVEDGAKVHVTFLRRAPAAAEVKALDPAAGGSDRFHVAGRTIYLHCPDGYGRTKLTNAFFERRLAVEATTRNWRTVTALADMVASREDR